MGSLYQWVLFSYGRYSSSRSSRAYLQLCTIADAGDDTCLYMHTHTHAHLIHALQCRSIRGLHGIILNIIVSFDFWVLLFTSRNQNQINLCNLDLGLFRWCPSSRCNHTASLTGKFRLFHLHIYAACASWLRLSISLLL